MQLFYSKSLSTLFKKQFYLKIFSSNNIHVSVWRHQIVHAKTRKFVWVTQIIEVMFIFSQDKHFWVFFFHFIVFENDNNTLTFSIKEKYYSFQHLICVSVGLKINTLKLMRVVANCSFDIVGGGHLFGRVCL